MFNAAREFDTLLHKLKGNPVNKKRMFIKHDVVPFAMSLLFVLLIILSGNLNKSHTIPPCSTPNSSVAK